MKDLTRASPTDALSTLVNLTASALTGKVSARPPAAPSTSPRPTLLDRLDRWLWTARQRDLEQALTNATDVGDVEARLRARERALLQRYY